MAYEDLQSRLRDGGHKQVDLANLLGLAPPAISKAFAGKRQFKHQEMQKIEAWLGTGKTLSGGDVRGVPLIGQIAAGRWREAVQSPIDLIPLPARDLPANAFALEVVGDSMDKVVDDGGTIVVDPDDKALFPKRYYAVLNSEGETTFKQFFNDPARLEPCSTNPEHRTIQIGDGQTFTVVGRVTRAIRSL